MGLSIKLFFNFGLTLFYGFCGKVHFCYLGRQICNFDGNTLFAILEEKYNFAFLGGKFDFFLVWLENMICDFGKKLNFAVLSENIICNFIKNIIFWF